MKSTDEIINDLTEYFKKFTEDGIDGSDRALVYYSKSSDEAEESPYFFATFFDGPYRVQSVRVDLQTGERSDLT